MFETEITVEFWEISNGNSPVVESIESLPVKAREKVYWVIKMLRRRGTALMETKFMSKLEGYDLHELRIEFQGILYRIFLVIVQGVACLLHMFKKQKGTRTLQKEINIALKRAKLYKATMGI